MKDPIKDVRNFTILMIVLSALNFLISMGPKTQALAYVINSAVIVYLIINLVGINKRMMFGYFMGLVYYGFTTIGGLIYLLITFISSLGKMPLVVLLIPIIIGLIIIALTTKIFIKLLKNKESFQ